MSDLRGFNAHTVEPSDSFDPIPAGEYLCIISHSEDKPTKSGNGSYLELEFEVIDGPFKGRKLWDRLNLDNPNELAVKIARATLSAICRAVVVMEPKDSCELHALPLLVKVRVEKRTDTDEPSNVIKGYRSRQGSVQAPVRSAADTSPKLRDSGAQAQTAAGGGGGGPPWRRQ